MTDTKFANGASWTLTTTGCNYNSSFDGIAYLGHYNGGTNNMITMFGTDASFPFTFAAAK